MNISGDECDSISCVIGAKRYKRMIKGLLETGLEPATFGFEDQCSTIEPLELCYFLIPMPTPIHTHTTTPTPLYTHLNISFYSHTQCHIHTFIIQSSTNSSPNISFLSLYSSQSSIGCTLSRIIINILISLWLVFNFKFKHFKWNVTCTNLVFN